MSGNLHLVYREAPHIHISNKGVPPHRAGPSLYGALSRISFGGLPLLTTTSAPDASSFIGYDVCVTYPLSLALFVITLHHTTVILAIVFNLTVITNSQKKFY